MENILKEALLTEFGLALIFGSKQEAMKQRRRFYALREKLRQSGILNYNELSFLPQLNGELWIIRRNTIGTAESNFLARPILSRELPNRILARGKKRQGLLASLLFAKPESKP